MKAVGFAAELNVDRGRSMVDVLEHALRGVRLAFRTRRRSRRDHHGPAVTAEASDLFVDLSRVPEPEPQHGRRRRDERPQLTLGEMLAAMRRAGRSHAEKRATRRLLKRTRKRSTK